MHFFNINIHIKYHFLEKFVYPPDLAPPIGLLAPQPPPPLLIAPQPPPPLPLMPISLSAMVGSFVSWFSSAMLS